MDAEQGAESATLDRRKVLLGAAAGVAGAGVVGSLVGADAAAANGRRHRHHHHRHRDMPKIPAPQPIPHGADLTDFGFDQFINWHAPGPAGTVTPLAFVGLEGEDVEPSTITDFEGFNATAIVLGSVETTNGPEELEFDLRVMQGNYIAADGSKHWGTFGFI